MASPSNLRLRRSAAQRQALAGVEREIRAQDSHNRRKYLREFNESFRDYDRLLDSTEVQNAVREADVVLVGDYHALPAAQRYAASLLEQRALAGGRPVVLGVETIFARDQHILDEWWRREIDDDELRQRIRFDLDWGYDWAPFHDLLLTARDHAHALYGLDCMPRDNLRKIGTRDRHAAAKIAEIRERHPSAVLFVLFGESHLAPGHLPRLIEKHLPGRRVLSVLQNIDALYWKAAGERAPRIEAVQVNDRVVCAFNATPLEKYESYRLFLDQWSRAGDNPDFAPTIYNLIDSLAGFFEINRYSCHNHTQPKFLVDLLPEVYGGGSDEMLRRMLVRKGATEAELQSLLVRVQECGCAYLPQVNAFWIREFQMRYAAEEAARFLHHACQGLPKRRNSEVGHSEQQPRFSPRDHFYARVLENAVGYFGSRVLDPSRPPVADDGVPLSRSGIEKAAQLTADADEYEVESLAQTWGYRVGDEIYEEYLAGRVAPARVRRLLLISLHEPGAARKACIAVMARLRSIRGRARRP